MTDKQLPPIKDTWVADVDQGKAALKDIVGVCHHVYAEARNSGFSKRQSFMLASVWFTKVLEQSAEQ